MNTANIKNVLKTTYQAQLIARILNAWRNASAGHAETTDAVEVVVPAAQGKLAMKNMVSAYRQKKVVEHL